ncbi:MAG: DUF2793 domain-containing protein, partial [Pseudomonadota bacterium]
LSSPPAAPAEGARYIVGDNPDGIWANVATQIATYIDGAWEFHVPQRGSRAWVEDEVALVVWTGSAWSEISSGQAGGSLESLGINTSPDAINRLSLKSDAALFSHDDVTPGTGDMRLALNKAQTAGNVSTVYQTGFVGHAECGLTGDDDFSIRASDDGATWRTALKVDKATGFVSFPSGADLATRDNLIINATFAVNQRAFSGALLAADTFGHDRWKSGAGGASYTVNADASVTLTSGALIQPIEISVPQPTDVTFSVEDVADGPLLLTVGGVSATLQPAAGRQFIVLNDVSITNGVLEIKCAPAAAATRFRFPKLERGNVASPFIPPAPGDELARCKRYFQIIKVSLNTGAAGQTVTYAVPLQPTMARNPARTRVGAFVSSTETGTQFTGGSTNSAVSFGIFNGGTGGVGGVFHLDAEL